MENKTMEKIKNRTKPCKKPYWRRGRVVVRRLCLPE